MNPDVAMVVLASPKPPDKLWVKVMKNREPPCPKGCMGVHDERFVCR